MCAQGIIAVILFTFAQNTYALSQMYKLANLCALQDLQVEDVLQVYAEECTLSLRALSGVEWVARCFAHHREASIVYELHTISRCFSSTYSYFSLCILKIIRLIFYFVCFLIINKTLKYLYYLVVFYWWVPLLGKIIGIFIF